MKYVLLFLSFSLLAQHPVGVFPVYDQPQARRISIEQVLIQAKIASPAPTTLSPTAQNPLEGKPVTS